MKRVCMLAGILMLAASPALAQDAPRVEVSGGYQLINLSVDVDPSLGVPVDSSQTLATGWYFDVAGNINPMFGVVFQVGGSYKTISESVTIAGVTADASVGLNVHQFMGGIRINARSDSPITPFGEVLVGGVRGGVDVSVTVTGPGGTIFDTSESASATDFGLEVGGGVDIRVSDRFGIRASADYIRVFAEGEGANLFRLGVGAVFSF
jgi:opacity protein-like surface antigen